jgi:hypothetical protein
MQDDALDRILFREPAILPSSGFTACVMAAVVREASAPAPIPFPWRRALPGLIASGLALAGLVHQLLAHPAIVAARFGLAWLPSSTQVLEIEKHFEIHWIVFALLLAFVSIRLSARFAARGESMES